MNESYNIRKIMYDEVRKELEKDNNYIDKFLKENSDIVNKLIYGKDDKEVVKKEQIKFDRKLSNYIENYLTELIDKFIDEMHGNYTEAARRTVKSNISMFVRIVDKEINSISREELENYISKKCKTVKKYCTEFYDRYNKNIKNKGKNDPATEKQINAIMQLAALNIEVDEIVKRELILNNKNSLEELTKGEIGSIIGVLVKNNLWYS